MAEVTTEQQELLEKVKKTAAEEIEKRGYTNPDKVNELMTEHLKGLDVEALRSIEGKPSELRAALDAVKTIGEKLATIELKNAQPQVQSIRGQIEKWQEDNKQVLEDLKAGKQVNLPQMQIRAAITMTTGASLGSSVYLPNAGVAPGVIDIVRTQPTFWNRLRKGRTRLNPYVWVNKTNKQGSAAFIGEGVLKPLTSFELETESSVPKKVAASSKVSTEILYDVDAMESMVMEELRFDVETAANTAVLTGTLSSTSPAGITTLASAYALTTIETDNPNFADAIRAAVAQIRVANFAGPIEAYISPIDGANMDMKKASTSGVYILPPFQTADGKTVAGATIYEDNNIVAGNLLIGDMSKYKIAMYQDFFINWGWENDDFRKNLVTAIGEMRFHQWMSGNHEGAIIYDTFANIIAAITP